VPEAINTVRDLIRADEGCRLTVYDDKTGRPIVPGTRVKGHPTIAWGRALDVHGVSQKEADAMLDADINYWLVACVQAFPWFKRLNEPRQAVLVSMAHQMGVPGLQGFTRALAAMEAGAYDVAAFEMLQSEWAKETPKRAKREADMMATGAWPS
jgi:lysozyme